MNRSGKTRKELVLEYLKARPNQWVPGLELMNERVGGLRAGARIFELNEEGFDIQRRPDPEGRSSVHQYRLVVEQPASRPPVFVQEAMFADGLR